MLAFILGIPVIFWAIWFFAPENAFRNIIFFLIFPIRAYIAYRTFLLIVPTWDFEKGYYSDISRRAWYVANKFFLWANPDIK